MLRVDLCPYQLPDHLGLLVDRPVSIDDRLAQEHIAVQQGRGGLSDGLGHAAE
jgi:hypothetical protein